MGRTRIKVFKFITLTPCGNILINLIRTPYNICNTFTSQIKGSNCGTQLMYPGKQWYITDVLYAGNIWRDKILANTHFLTFDGKILVNLLLQAIQMVKLRHLEGKNLAIRHEFANIFPLQIFPTYSTTVCDWPKYSHHSNRNSL